MICSGVQYPHWKASCSMNAEVIPESVKQRHARIDLECVLDTIDHEG